MAGALVGPLFVLGSRLPLLRVRRFHWRDLRDESFLVGLAVVFVVQILSGVSVIDRPKGTGDADTVAVSVIVCFLVGIARSWDLIGGPGVGFRAEPAKRLQDRDDTADGELRRDAPTTG